MSSQAKSVSSKFSEENSVAENKVRGDTRSDDVKSCGIALHVPSSLFPPPSHNNNTYLKIIITCIYLCV